MIKPSVSGGSVTVAALVQGGGEVVGIVQGGTRGAGGREKAACLEMGVDGCLCCVLLVTRSRVLLHHRSRPRCSRTPAARSQSRATWRERSVFGKRDGVRVGCPVGARRISPVRGLLRGLAR